MNLCCNGVFTTEGHGARRMRSALSLSGLQVLRRGNRTGSNMLDLDAEDP